MPDSADAPAVRSCHVSAEAGTAALFHFVPFLS